MKLDEQIQQPTTRRTVVKTGAKLAYAAPLVAATFKMSGLNAAAQGAGSAQCIGGACGTATACGANPATGVACTCFTATNGGSVCAGRQFCTALPKCGPGFTCPDGFTCSTTTCCGSRGGAGVCQPACGAPGTLSDDYFVRTPDEAGVCDTGEELTNDNLCAIV